MPLLGKINIFGKSPIYLVFRSLIHNFDLCRSFYHSEMKRKTSFPFAFRSFIRTFNYVEDRLHLFYLCTHGTRVV